MQRTLGGRGDGSVGNRGLWRNRNFLLLWWAYGISAFGDHLSELGLMRLLRVEASVHQVRTQALMTFVFFLPFFCLGWLCGAVADRFRRKRIMIGADVARGLVILLLPMWVAATVSGCGESLKRSDLVLAVMPLLLLGLFAAFFSPSRMALLPELVDESDLTRANSLINGLGTISALLSQWAGGVLAQINPVLNFRTDAATFAASACLVAGIREPTRSRRKAATGGFGGEVRTGLWYLITHRTVLELVGLITLFWTAAAVFSSVLPSMVFRYYGLNYAWLGFLRGSLAGGMLAGAVLLAYFADSVRPGLVNVAALCATGFCLLMFAISGGVASGLPLAFAIGFCGSWLLVSVNTTLQRALPNWVRGKVFGLVDMSTVGWLLVATGLLGLVPIKGLDLAVRHILAGLGAVMLASGVWVHRVLARRAGLKGWELLLWWLNEFYCKWWFRLKRVGPCRLPKSGPAIVAANHTCSIDPLLLHASGNFRPIGFMVAAEYYDLPVFGRLLRRIGCVPTARSGRDVAATKAALRLLREGRLLGIFPEGRIARPGEHLPAKPGVALLATRADVQIVPVHISGTRYTESVLWAFFRRHRAVVRYGKPIRLELPPDAEPDKETLVALAEQVMQRIRSLGGGDEAA